MWMGSMEIFSLTPKNYVGGFHGDIQLYNTVKAQELCGSVSQRYLA